MQGSLVKGFITETPKNVTKLQLLFKLLVYFYCIVLKYHLNFRPIFWNGHKVEKELYNFMIYDNKYARFTFSTHLTNATVCSVFFIIFIVNSDLHLTDSIFCFEVYVEAAPRCL